MTCSGKFELRRCKAESMVAYCGAQSKVGTAVHKLELSAAHERIIDLAKEMR